MRKHPFLPFVNVEARQELYNMLVRRRLAMPKNGWEGWRASMAADILSIFRDDHEVEREICPLPSMLSMISGSIISQFAVTVRDTNPRIPILEISEPGFQMGGRLGKTLEGSVTASLSRECIMGIK